MRQAVSDSSAEPGTMARGEQARGEHARGNREFGEVVRSAQRSLARALGDARARPGLDRETCLRWMALESMLCRANARALDLLLPLLPADGPRSQVVALARACRDGVRRATVDLRRIDVVVPGPALEIDAWHAALRQPDPTDPWRLLGVIAVHGHAIGDAVGEALDTLPATPFLARGSSSYLDRHRAAAPSVAPGDEDEAALGRFLLGAWEGAVGYHLSYLPVLQPARAHPEPRNQSGRRWPQATTGETAR